MNTKLGLTLVVAFAIAFAQDSAPPPGPDEQAKVLADASMFAAHHDTGLPNFTCLQNTRRFEDMKDSGWQPTNTIVERLIYMDHREIYRVIEINGQPVNMTHDQLRGASSASEFESVMKTIFVPETGAEFVWQSWFSLRERNMYVYAYRVPALRSSYHIEVSERSFDLATAYHGLIFIDVENHFINRITLHADEIPPSFPLQEVSLTLDYDYTRIGAAQYVLPLQFELRSREGNRLVKNELHYENYREFNAVSVIAHALSGHETQSEAKADNRKVEYSNFELP